MSTNEKENTTTAPPTIPAKQPGPFKSFMRKTGRNMLRRLPGFLIVTVAAIGFVLLAMHVRKPKEEVKPNPPAPVNVTVEVVRPLPEAMDTFSIPGIVAPNSIVEVAAETSARVEAYAGRKDKINKDYSISKGPASAGKVDEGEKVREGQPIMYLNSDLVRAHRDRARAELTFQTRELERIKSLFKRNVATAMEVDSVQVRLDKAKADLELAEANLERSIIVSPIDGILNSLPVDCGEYVTPGRVIAQIVDMDKVKIYLDVPEKDVPFLKVGNEETITFGHQDDKQIAGKITYISEVADPRTHTTELQLTVDNSKRILRSGQIVHVRLLRRVFKDAIMVPLSAIIPLEKGYVVYLEKDGKAIRREVELDSSMFLDKRIRVIKGLRKGDRLIISGHKQQVGPGQLVKDLSKPQANVATKKKDQQISAKPQKESSESAVK